MKYLFGMHDPGGEHLFADAKGWIVFTDAIGSNAGDKSGGDYRQWSDAGYGVMVRLNHSYGSGTIPLPGAYNDFAQRVANYIANSKGCDTWIIANEPNHSQERPNGQTITPAMYVDCFKRVHAKVREVAGTRHGLIPAPVAPWNMESGDWLEYHKTIWRDLWQLAAGVAIHAYTHGASPSLITSEERVQGWHWHFRTYRDQLSALPQGARGLPVYITESNQGDHAWVDANTGWVQAAYDEIDRWNQTDGTQKIHCLCLYRWPAYDRWGIVDKPGVHQDIRAAVRRGYPSPVGTIKPMPEPSTPSTPPPVSAPDSRDIDPRLVQRGVTIETPPLQPGQEYWRVQSARWFNEQESQGRHHIYVETLMPNGNVVAGVPFKITWPGNSAGDHTKAGRGFDAGNFPMSPSRNEFSVAIDSGVPSERVVGIGMGAETPGGGFNSAIHTSTLVTFRRAIAPTSQQHTVHIPAVSTGPTPVQPPQQPATVPTLVHPVLNPARRVISQGFGANPQDYERFGLAGHTGIDFAVVKGTTVVAVDVGQVVEIGDGSGDYGIYVKLRHAWGESLYAHLSTVLTLRVGNWVDKGEVIGMSGNTGNSTGPHLHFAMRVNPYTRGAPYDGYTDPAPYLQPQPAQASVDLLSLIKAAAQEYGLEWQLLASVAWAESSWNPRAVSGAGAKGLMQLTEGTWAEWSAKVGGSDVFDAVQNLNVGAAYLAWLLRQTNGDAYKAAIAYVWGIGNLLSGKPVPEEAYDYSDKVVHGRDLLKAVQP